MFAIWVGAALASEAPERASDEVLGRVVLASIAGSFAGAAVGLLAVEASTQVDCDPDDRHGCRGYGWLGAAAGWPIGGLAGAAIGAAANRRSPAHALLGSLVGVACGAPFVALGLATDTGDLYAVAAVVGLVGLPIGGGFGASLAPVRGSGPPGIALRISF